MMSEFEKNANLYLVFDEALNELAFGRYREEKTTTNGVVTVTEKWVQSGECLLFLYKQMSIRLKKEMEVGYE